MANKVILLAIAFAFVAVVSAQGGVKDWAGNYYDLTTGQYSSSLTGRVYNTVPHVAAPIVASPYLSSYAAPLTHPLAYGYAAAPYPLSYGRLLIR